MNNFFTTGRNVLFALMALVILTINLNCTKESEDDDLVGNWKKGFEFEGVGRTEAVSFTIGNVVYIGGGFDGTDRLNDFWKFDQLTGTWIRIADFPGTPRNSAAAFAVNGKGYVGTGIDENNDELKDFWEYNPGADTWTRKADFGGTARYNAIGFAIGDAGYISTGYDGNFLKDLWQYNPASDSWVQRSSLAGSKRSEAVVFVHNEKAYVLTGINNGSYLNDFWVYDPKTNTWEEKRKISDATDEEYDDDYLENIRRGNASVFLMNNKAYLTCGSRSGLQPGTWEYDIASDLWIEKTSFEGSGREGAIGFNINNRGYIVTGNNGSFRFDDLWEFFPSAEQDDDDN